MVIYKFDFDCVGGMNVWDFIGWGGEDWELLDRIFMLGMEVERFKILDFYYFYYFVFVGSNNRVGV